jgi:hypothetical protein
MNNPLKLHISYVEEDRKHFEELRDHLIMLKRTGMIESNFEIGVESADIIVVLITTKYLNSDKFDTELMKGIKISNESNRFLQNKELSLPRIIPCKIAECEIIGNTILQRLIPRGKEYLNPQNEFHLLVGEIRKLIESINTKK